MPYFDIQKAIDYPRSDFDSNSVEEPPEDDTAQQMEVFENRIDEILAKGGIDFDSQGSFQDIGESPSLPNQILS